jgi:GNAT superfamily N-acetyltransferase
VAPAGAHTRRKDRKGLTTGLRAHSLPTASPPESAGYPTALCRGVTTRSGRSLFLRPIRPSDAAGLVAFHLRLSALSVYRRFFSLHRTLTTKEVDHFTGVDYLERLALVVEDGDLLVAVGRYDRTPGTDEAEVAFVVADDCQHDGIATVLLETLAEAAWGNGITSFVALVLPENREMLGVFRDSGFRVNRASDDDTVTVRFPIEPDDTSRAAHAARAGGGGRLPISDG